MISIRVFVWAYFEILNQGVTLQNLYILSLKYNPPKLLQIEAKSQDNQ